MGAKVSGTRVEMGASVGNSKDMRSGSLKQPGGVSVTSETNAKVPIDGVQNEARASSTPTAPATRKTTTGS